MLSNFHHLCGPSDVQLLQLRRGLEGLPNPASEKMSYYERWAASVAVISMERGTIQQREIDTHLGVSTVEPAVKCAPAAYICLLPYQEAFIWPMQVPSR